MVGPTTPRNAQVVTDPAGEILWLSPALPGRTHDLTAARTHKILRICARQGVPILADTVYIDAGDWVTTAKRQRHLFQLYLEGRHAEQIARQLNISVKTVRNRCHDVRTQITEGLYAYLLLNEGE